MLDSSADPVAVFRELHAAEELIERVAHESGSSLAIQKRLRDDFPADLVRAALTLRDLRQRAALSGRFSRAEQMWFDARGLEQASAEGVADHKAQRFASLRDKSGEPPLVADFCCGIGADAIALARAGCRVHAVDLSPVCCQFVAWNAEVFGVADRLTVTCDDVLQVETSAEFLHIDPDRRPAGRKRVLRVEDCQPGLDDLQRLMAQFRGGAIKLSPASNFGGKFPGCEIELVSLDGECREATVWFGELAGAESSRATVLPQGESIAAEPLSAWTNVGDLGEWLYDPDPAVVRSGLVDVVAERLGLRRLDDSEEYLTGDSLIDSPFVRPFRVLESLANNQKQVRRAVRRAGFGQVEIKCRHIPIDADAVRRKLPLDGTVPGVVTFARQAGKATAIVCCRPEPSALGVPVD
ncbi:MAG: class I SAM-dependent methyltransferase [Planctomycetota bacterium]|jgi:hypothetical protein